LFFRPLNLAQKWVVALNLEISNILKVDDAIILAQEISTTNIQSLPIDAQAIKIMEVVNDSRNEHHGLR
jgi:hypothetical protein